MTHRIVMHLYLMFLTNYQNQNNLFSKKKKNLANSEDFFFIKSYTRVLHDYVWVITFTFFQQQKMKYAVCTEHGTISNWEQQNARNSQFCQHVPSWFVYNTIM